MVISLLWFRSWPRDCDAVERPFASTSGVRPYVLFEGRIYKLLALCKHSSLEGSLRLYPQKPPLLTTGVISNVVAAYGSSSSHVTDTVAASVPLPV